MSGLIPFKMKYYLHMLAIVSVFQMGFSVQSHAQTLLDQKITWSCATVKDPVNGETRSMSSIFTTGNGQLVWKQGDKLTYSFTITGVNGVWQNPELNGSITINLSLGNKSCSATLSRTVNGIKLSLPFPSTGADAKTYDFIIDRYEIQ
jgi:hypothetical protein